MPVGPALRIFMRHSVTFCSILEVASDVRSGTFSNAVKFGCTVAVLGEIFSRRRWHYRDYFRPELADGVINSVAMEDVSLDAYV